MDSSAIVKLILHEPERDALRHELERWDGFVSSALLEVESLRAAARVGRQYVEVAHTAIRAVSLIPVDDAVLEAAALLRPATLRTLDAVHIATALSLGGDLGVVFAYDQRLLDAASAHGLSVGHPR